VKQAVNRSVFPGRDTHRKLSVFAFASNSGNLPYLALIPAELLLSEYFAAGRFPFRVFAEAFTV